MDDHPLLVPPLCCLGIPILYLFADYRFICFNILEEGDKYLNGVLCVRQSVRRTSAHKSSTVVSPTNSPESVRRALRTHCQMGQDLYEAPGPFVSMTGVLISSEDSEGAAVQR